MSPQLVKSVSKVGPNSEASLHFEKIFSGVQGHPLGLMAVAHLFKNEFHSQTLRERLEKTSPEDPFQGDPFLPKFW